MTPEEIIAASPLLQMWNLDNETEINASSINDVDYKTINVELNEFNIENSLCCLASMIDYRNKCWNDNLNVNATMLEDLYVEIGLTEKQTEVIHCMTDLDRFHIEQSSAASQKGQSQQSINQHLQLIRKKMEKYLKKRGK